MVNLIKYIVTNNKNNLNKILKIFLTTIVSCEGVDCKLFNTSGLKKWKGG